LVDRWREAALTDGSAIDLASRRRQDRRLERDGVGIQSKFLRTWRVIESNRPRSIIVIARPWKPGYRLNHRR
jgi:hypothetical protein